MTCLERWKHASSQTMASFIFRRLEGIYTAILNTRHKIRSDEPLYLRYCKFTQYSPCNTYRESSKRCILNIPSRGIDHEGTPGMYTVIAESTAFPATNSVFSTLKGIRTISPSVIEKFGHRGGAHPWPLPSQSIVPISVPFREKAYQEWLMGQVLSSGRGIWNSVPNGQVVQYFYGPISEVFAFCRGCKLMWIAAVGTGTVGVSIQGSNSDKAGA
jgi:hypothetical protein